MSASCTQNITLSCPPKVNCAKNHQIECIDNYCICSIRHRGYYLFYHPILCSVYSRAATNRERHLLISVDLSLIPRPLPHFQCTLDTADEAEESDPFADIEEDDDKFWKNELVLDDCYYKLYAVNVREPCKPHPMRFIDVRTCYFSGYYLRVATISFSVSGGVASIWERRLIKSSVWSSEYGSTL